MTLFVVLGLVAVVVGVLVAVALGVRSMRAEEHQEDDHWESFGAGGEPADAGESGRSRGDRRRPGARRASGRTTRADHGRPRRYERQGDLGAEPQVSRSGYGTDRGFDAGYQNAGYQAAQQADGRGARAADHDLDAGHDRRAAADSGSPHSYDAEPMVGALTDAVRTAAQPVLRAGAADAPRRVQPGRRANQQKTPPAKRPRRGRGSDGWNDTDWDRVSDEDYWAEMSSDKPLAARTAQSAADLRSPEPEQKKQPDTRTDQNLARAAASATVTSDAGGARRAHANLAEPAAAQVTARRIGHAADPGLPAQVAGRPVGIGYVAADYADPNLAVLASLSEPAGERRDAGMSMVPAPVDPSVGVAAAWATTGPNRSDWSQPGQDYGATGGNPASRHTVPPDAYGSQSYGLDQQAVSHPREMPGYVTPANPGYAAGNSYDSAPNGPGAPPTISYGTYDAGPDQATGRFGDRADVGGAHGSHYGASGSVSAGSYGTGAYDNSNGAASYNAVPPDAMWGPPGSSQGRTADGSWHGAQSGAGVPAGAGLNGGYRAPSAPNGHPGSFAAPPPGTQGTPGGRPHPATGGPANGYASPSASGGFASGYLSRSALSTRQPTPEPLAAPGSGNPYGSYVTGPVHPADDGASGTAPHRRQRDPAEYDERGAYRGYNGGPHH